MKISSYNTFSSDLKSHGLEYALKHSSELGFNGVELIHIRGALPSLEQAKRARERFDAYGLPAVCYSVYANLSSPGRSTVEAELKHHADIAAALGSPYLHHTLAPALALTPDSPRYEDIFDAVLNSALRVTEHCSRLGLVCLYEPQGVYFNGLDGLGRFLDEMKRRTDNVGICGDMGNPMFSNTNPVDIFERFSPYIKHVHAKNYLITNSCQEGLECYQVDKEKWICDVALQSGSVDLGACLSKLHGYDGYISIEKGGTDAEVLGYIEYLKSLA